MCVCVCTYTRMQQQLMKKGDHEFSREQEGAYGRILKEGKRGGKCYDYTIIPKIREIS